MANWLQAALAGEATCRSKMANAPHFGGGGVGGEICWLWWTFLQRKIVEPWKALWWNFWCRGTLCWKYPWHCVWHFDPLAFPYPKDFSPFFLCGINLKYGRQSSLGRLRFSRAWNNGSGQQLSIVNVSLPMYAFDHSMHINLLRKVSVDPIHKCLNWTAGVCSHLNEKRSHITLCRNIDLSPL